MAARWTHEVEGGPRRVNHAAVTIRDRFVFSFGGYCTGDGYASIIKMDVHVYDTVPCKWVKLCPVSDTDADYDCVPFMRYGHSASAVGDLVFIFGGRNDRNGACNTLFCFNTEMLKWSKPKTHGNPPAARDGHSACLLNMRIYVFGGYEEVGQCFSNTIEFLDVESMTWNCPRVTGSPAAWRDFHSATAVGTNMYIFGGRGDRLGLIHTGEEVYCNIVQVFNTVTNSWRSASTSGDVPVGRRSHSAMAYGKYIFVFGGYNGIEQKHYGDVYRLDTETCVWTKMDIPGKAPCPRRRHCCCLVENKALIFGGTSPMADSVLVDGEFNLQDHSDLFVLDLRPSLRSLCKLAVLQHKLDHTLLPKVLSMELAAMEAGMTSPRSSQG